MHAHFRALAAILTLAAVAFASPANADKFDGPSLGVSFRAVTEHDREVLGPKTPRKAIIVIDCDEKSAAYEAGMRNHDIVTHLNGKIANDTPSATEAIASLEVGRKAVIVVQRPIQIGDRIQFKKGSIRVTPITRRDFLTSAIVASEAPGGDAKIYRHHAEPEGFGETHLQLQLVETTKGMVPFLHINYGGDDWLFIRKVVFDLHGKPSESKSSHEWGHHNADGRVWEWTRFPCSPASPATRAIDAMKDYTLQKIYLHGDTFVKEIGVESYEAHRINMVANYYEMMTGEDIKPAKDGE